MTLERSASIMDDIFHSSDLESHGRLLRIMHDFLVSESTKHHEEQKGLSDLLRPCAVLILRRWQ
jgi:cohesin loading factor subunit SCC2